MPFKISFKNKNTQTNSQLFKVNKVNGIKCFFFQGFYLKFLIPFRQCQQPKTSDTRKDTRKKKNLMKLITRKKTEQEQKKNRKKFLVILKFINFRLHRQRKGRN